MVAGQVESGGDQESDGVAGGQRFVDGGAGRGVAGGGRGDGGQDGKPQGAADLATGGATARQTMTVGRSSRVRRSCPASRWRVNALGDAGVMPAASPSSVRTGQPLALMYDVAAVVVR
jgi:hypothetical protein